MIKAITVSDWKKVHDSETVPQRDNTRVGFLVGAAVGAAAVGIPALIHNAVKNEHQQQELQRANSQGYWEGVRQTRNEMTQALAAKDAQIQHLDNLLHQKDLVISKKDAEIDCLNAVVENLAKTVKLQQVQITAPVLSQNSDGDDGNGNSQVN